jgi:hypothetical protein
MILDAGFSFTFLLLVSNNICKWGSLRGIKSHYFNSISVSSQTIPRVLTP